MYYRVVCCLKQDRSSCASVKRLMLRCDITRRYRKVRSARLQRATVQAVSARFLLHRPCLTSRKFEWLTGCEAIVESDQVGESYECEAPLFASSGKGSEVYDRLRLSLCQMR